MLALQRSSLEHFLRVLPCDGLSVINPPLKGTQLGAGGGQVRLRRNQGEGRGFRTPLSLIQLGPEGSDPARILLPRALQLQVLPTLQVCSNLGHPAIDLLLDSGLASPDDIFCLSNLTLPRLQLLKLEAALHSSQSQRLLALPDLLFLGRRPPQ